MTENIIDRLTQAFTYPARSQALLTQVDGDKEMVLNRQYFPNYSGVLGRPALPNTQAAKIVGHLVGTAVQFCEGQRFVFMDHRRFVRRPLDVMLIREVVRIR